MIPADVYLVHFPPSTSAICIGESPYIYVVAAVNFAIVLLSVFELLRTRTWKGLNRFDFTDVKSLILGVAKGGTHVAEEAWKIHAQHDAGIGNEKSEDKALGKIKVRLEGSGAGSRG